MGFIFRFNKPAGQIIKDSGINDKALLFAAKTARTFMDGYIPMDTGALAKNVRLSVENDKGTVHYTQPYASFCYYGEKKNFRRDKHEKASAYWDKAMLPAHKDALTKKVNGFIKKR